MLEAGMNLINPNICILAQYIVVYASHSVLDRLNLNFIYAVIIPESQQETLFVGI